MSTNKLAKKVINKLKRKGIICQIIGMSDFGSYYIHLKSNCNGIRVSNHKENDGLNYHYNIRTDLENSFVLDGRHYFSSNDISKAINYIVKNERKKYEIGVRQ